jgi:hypothetical protein
MRLLKVSENCRHCALKKGKDKVIPVFFIRESRHEGVFGNVGIDTLFL